MIVMNPFAGVIADKVDKRNSSLHGCIKRVLINNCLYIKATIMD